MSEKKLTPNEKRFCAIYISNGRNGTRAYMAVNPKASDASARVSASEWLSKPNIQEEIDRLTRDGYAKEKMGAEEALAILSRTARAEYPDAYDSDGILLPMAKMPPHVRTALKGFTVVDGRTFPIFKDSLKAAELIAKHLKLLDDRLQISVDEDLAELLREARERYKKT